MNRINRMSGMTMAVLELVRIGLAMAAVFLFMVDGSKAYEAYTSQFWPTTTGEITRSAVDATADFSGNRSYYSRIKYAYAVAQAVDQSAVNQAVNDDDPLIGTRVGIDPMPPVDSRAIAEARLQPYPKGSSVEVYYNPNRPRKSMLEPHFSLVYLIRPFVGLLFLGVAISLRRVGREQ